MIEVWGRRNSNNVMPVMWALGELQLPHVRHNVGGSFGGLDQGDYLALNPNARIPTLRDDACVVWESNAIVRYLAARYGEGILWDNDPAGRALADRWMDWHKTTLFPSFIELFWAIVRTEPAQRDRQAVDRRAALVGDALTLLDAHLQDNSFVAGEPFTMGDIPLGVAVYRYLHLDIPRADLRNVKRWYDHLCQRPAYQEHVMFEFGANPAQWLALEQAGA